MHKDINKVSEQRKNDGQVTLGNIGKITLLCLEIEFQSKKKEKENHEMN